MYRAKPEVTYTVVDHTAQHSGGYLAIGQTIPTPAPETVQEFHMNPAMYDAQQGSTSGAHIDMNTSSGTNTMHDGPTFTAGQIG